jgi:hypothetical protein
MRNSVLLFLFLVTIALSASAQEYIAPLGSNPVLTEQFEKKNDHSASRTAITLLTLPFIDDFSKGGPWPDTSMWIDDNVFINGTFPKAPPTIGVATFDGLKNNGLPYDWNVSSGSSKKADSLTSQPVDLSGLTLADSVYFTFFYQAQGRGNAPEASDSLVLEFRNSLGDWVEVWSKAGYSLPANDSTFNFVKINVPAAYYYSGFQFKFYNYATLSGNVDHWHLDYVYLDKNRFNPKHQFEDISFVYPASSLLKNYRAMPWKQFVPSEMASSFWNPIRNNGTAFVNTTYSYTVRDESGAVVYSLPSPGITGNINPYDTSGYTACPTSGGCAGLLNVPVSFTYPTMVDCTFFEIKHQLTVNGFDINHSNDTLKTRVPFYNYYAYDDGSAELAYGVSSAFARIAVKYSLNQPDTLRAVAIYWNPFIEDVHTKPIRITVWGDAAGQPGTIIYQGVVEYPEYMQGYNGFKFYTIPDTSLSLVSGTFYVGFTQVQAETLNVGLDMNTNAQTKIFYNTSGAWNNSIYQGALMIRPYFGEAFSTGVEETKPQAAVFNVYPNPAYDRLSIRMKGRSDEKMKLVIFDAYGRIVMPLQDLSAETLDVSQLAAGVYFIRIQSSEGAVSTERFIIAR